MLGFHMGKMPALKTGIVHDTEYWLQQINRASVVANVKAGLLDPEAARRLSLPSFPLLTPETFTTLFS